jgi:hypothetical protein
MGELACLRTLNIAYEHGGPAKAQPVVLLHGSHYPGALQRGTSERRLSYPLAWAKRWHIKGQ